jgi:glycosyltransferase involved in cell wall biosynthesis
MINNGGDIIESFIRYNYNFIDEMIFIDNGCTDNTISIIRNLIKEGFKLTIYDESLMTFNLFEFENKYINKIIKEIHPDIVIPLDADEFIIADGDPRRALEKLPLNKIYYIHWQWYVMTPNDDSSELFIPKRMQYCLKNAPYNYSDGKLVTKIIIPAKYFSQKRLKVSAGHHTAFGNGKFLIEEISNIRQAHYRIVSEDQFIEKTFCYTIRDIATLSHNYETAQRTNQMAMIESNNIHDIAYDASFAGYDKEIIYKPINLEYCTKTPLLIKYCNSVSDGVLEQVRRTGCEMAIRYYNCEREKRERKGLEPVVLYLDSVKGKECIFPDPSIKLTMVTACINVRAYITTVKEIRFLKANYRLIITPEWLKFIPHRFVIILDSDNYDVISKELVSQGVDKSQIVSWEKYREKIGILGRIKCDLSFLPGSTELVRKYMKRNGMKNTVIKTIKRVKQEGKR